MLLRDLLILLLNIFVGALNGEEIGRLFNDFDNSNNNGIKYEELANLIDNASMTTTMFENRMKALIDAGYDGGGRSLSLSLSLSPSLSVNTLLPPLTDTYIFNLFVLPFF